MSSNNNGNGKPRYKLHKRPYKEIFADWKNQSKTSTKDLGVDMVAGLAGAMAGAVIGRSSLLWGALVNFSGHFLETKFLSTMGTGMAVVNIVSGDPLVALSGDAEPTKWEKAKERLTAFKDGLKHQLYLDKFMKKDPGTTSTSSDAPVGEIKHFVYPYGGNSTPEIDMSALDAIESQLVNSAKNFQDKQEMQSTNSVSGNGAFAGAEIVDPLY
jgi:hypothetical protein